MNEQKKNKLILAILLLTPLLVMLAATVTYKIGYVPETKKNHGVLLSSPVEVKNLALTKPVGEVYSYREDNKDYGRWHLFIFGDKDCATEACKKQLWETRQLHVALAHRAHYVKRYYISVGENVSSQLQEIFAKEHTRLAWLNVDQASYQKFVSAANTRDFGPIEKSQFVLVDPNGWAMMYYSLDTLTGHDVMADLKYLLKKKGK